MVSDTNFIEFHWNRHKLSTFLQSCSIFVTLHFPACSSIIHVSWLKSRYSPRWWKRSKLRIKPQAKKNHHDHNSTSLKQNRGRIRGNVEILHWWQPRSQSVSHISWSWRLKCCYWRFCILSVAQFQCWWCHYSSSPQSSCFTFGVNSPRRKTSILELAAFLWLKSDYHLPFPSLPTHHLFPLLELTSNSPTNIFLCNHLLLFLFIN